MMESSAILFYGLAGLVLISAIGVVSASNPIYSALSLVTTMFGVAGVFLNLGAPFIGAVQVIVYAGAVVVLFVMVVMLLDLKKIERPFKSGRLTNGIKIAICAFLVGMVVSAARMSIDFATQDGDSLMGVGLLVATKDLAQLLFSKYLFVFEVISIVILVVIVGAISLARGPGGTHVGPQ